MQDSTMEVSIAVPHMTLAQSQPPQSTRPIRGRRGHSTADRAVPALNQCNQDCLAANREDCIACGRKIRAASVPSCPVHTLKLHTRGWTRRYLPAYTLPFLLSYLVSAHGPLAPTRRNATRPNPPT